MLCHVELPGPQRCSWFLKKDGKPERRFTLLLVLRLGGESRLFTIVAGSVTVSVNSCGRKVQTEEQGVTMAAEPATSPGCEAFPVFYFIY